MKVEILFLLSLFCGVIHCQDACERITMSELGAATASTSGFISQILAPGGDSTAQPDVTLMDINIVCEAQHMMEDRYRFTSVVAEFTCFSTDDRLPNCSDSSVVHTEQFDFGCDNGNWSTFILGIDTFVRTTNPTATLTTELDTDCIICVNPDHSSITSDVTIEPDTHCRKCDNCPDGLQRCYVDTANSQQACCSYFNSASCVSECPDQLVPDTTSNQCVVCDQLIDNCETCEANGQDVTCTGCQTGFFLLQNGACTSDCNDISNGCSNCTSDISGNGMCTECQDGLMLSNGACTSPTSGGGCEVGCIVGIVIGILVFLLILIVLIVLIVWCACCRDRNSVGSKTV